MAERYQVFLSYASSDRPAVEELASRLRGAGIDVWFDQWKLIPGDPWQEVMEAALKSSDSVAVFFGPSGTGPWHNEEMRAALDLVVSEKRGRIFGVLLPGADKGNQSHIPLFLKIRTWVEFGNTLNDDDAFYRLLCGIQGIEPGPPQSGIVDSVECPYRGLEAFDVDDARFFFGRDTLIQSLLQKLRVVLFENRLLSIVGPSGCGKSSLARAGVLARLKEDAIPGSSSWSIAICRPGPRPLESLALALSRFIPTWGSPPELQRQMDGLENSEETLHLASALILRYAPPDHRLIVLIDQFEEVFSLCPVERERQRKAFIDNIVYAGQVSEGRTIILLTLRADFYGDCSGYANLAKLISEQQKLVWNFEQDELRAAIEAPALRVGYEVDPALTVLLIRDTEGQPGRLPLLQHALFQVWGRRQGRLLAASTYEEIGGVAGALNRYAEALYGELGTADKEVCKRILLRLVQPGRGTGATRRRLHLDELLGDDPKEGNAIVQKFLSARLLTSGGDDGRTIELAHEALTVRWERLASWIRESYETLLFRQRLGEAAEEWRNQGGDSSHLYRDARLARAEDWYRENAGEATPLIQQFLEASRDLQGLQTRKMRSFRAVLAAMILFLLVVASAALVNYRVSERTRQLNRALDLSTRARTTFEDNPQLGLLLATAGMKLADKGGIPHLAPVESTFRWAQENLRGRPLASGRVYGVAISRDHRLLATFNVEQRICIWSVERVPERLLRCSDRISELAVMRFSAISPDNKWLLVPGRGHLYLFDLNNLTKPFALFAQEISGLLGEPFSFDGKWIASLRGDKVVLRNTRSKAWPRAAVTLDVNPNAIAFGKDEQGDWLAIVREDRTLLTWDLASGGARIKEHLSPVFLTVASQEGRVVVILQDESGLSLARLNRNGEIGVSQDVSGCRFGTLSMHGPGGPWFKCTIEEKVNGASLFRLGDGANAEKIDLPERVLVADFSSGGNKLVFQRSSGDLYAQQVHAPYQAILQRTMQPRPQPFVRFLQDDRWFLTHGASEAPRLWDTSVIDESANGQASRQFNVSMSQQGILLSRSGRSGLLQLSDSLGRLLSSPIPAVDGRALHLAISPKGRWIAANIWRKGIFLWKRSDKEFAFVLLPRLDSGAYESWQLSFSADEKWLFLCCGTRGMRIYDLRNLRAYPRSVQSDPSGGFSYSPRSRLLAVVENSGEIKIKRLSETDIEEVESFDLGRARMTSVRASSFSPSEKWLAIGGNHDVLLLKELDGEEIFLENKDRDMNNLAFSPTGRWLASGGTSGYIQLWRFLGRDTAHSPIIFEASSGRIQALAFSSDEKKLISLDSQGRTRHWDLDTDELIKAACKNVGRNLTGEEWARYFRPEPYREGEPCP